ncbi:MAG: hypothetical protein ACO1N8_11335 [Methylophilus sp.]
MQNVKSAVALIGMSVFAVEASAASMIPAGTLTTVTTDAVDTVKDLAIQGLPLVTGIALAWFIVTGVKKLLAKGGIN